MKHLVTQSVVNTNGKREKGRPKRGWIDDIADTPANTIQQIHHMTLSRNHHLHSTPRGIQRQRKERRLLLLLLA
jgi:hypothetical protein